MIQLPSRIAAYVDASNVQDAAGVANCFVADATVRDEGTLRRGRAEIEAWARESAERYQATIEPHRVIEMDALCMLRASVRGNFPGSPVILDFSFVLQADGIQSLEINV